MDELALLREAQHGRVESFNTLVLHYQSSAYNVAYRLIGDPDGAADATQEAFISAYRHLTDFRGGNFKAWLMRIVTNVCYDELRRRKRQPAVSLDAPDDDDEPEFEPISPGEGPEAIAQRNALNQIIQKCLNDLPTEQRVVAVLCDVQEYDYTEIAVIVNTSLGTVKSRISRARQKLRECLQSAAELLPESYRLKGMDES